MAQTPQATEAVELEVRVAATPETLWEFFIDPEKMTRWKGRRAELDPRPGGTYRVELNDQAIARGEYVELVPHSRVVFTWGWEGDHPVQPGSSTVEINLEPDGDSTLVRLRHTGLPDEHQRVEHTGGWNHFLARLATAGAGGDPGPDPFAEGAPKA